jgi:hypothetical protein
LNIISLHTVRLPCPRPKLLHASRFPIPPFYTSHLDLRPRAPYTTPSASFIPPLPPQTHNSFLRASSHLPTCLCAAPSPQPANGCRRRWRDARAAPPRADTEQARLDDLERFVAGFRRAAGGGGGSSSGGGGGGGGDRSSSSSGSGGRGRTSGGNDDDDAAGAFLLGERATLADCVLPHTLLLADAINAELGRPAGRPVNYARRPALRRWRRRAVAHPPIAAALGPAAEATRSWAALKRGGAAPPSRCRL